MSLEQLPKDVLIEIALNLDAPNLINFCKIQKRENQAICQNEHFWRQKLLKDHPNYQELFETRLLSFRDEYIRVHRFDTELKANIQIFIDRYFGAMQNYLDLDTYKENLKQAIMKVYVDIAKVKQIEGELADEFAERFTDTLDDYIDEEIGPLMPRIASDLVGRSDNYDYFTYFENLMRNLRATVG